MSIPQIALCTFKTHRAFYFFLKQAFPFEQKKSKLFGIFEKENGVP